MAQYYIMTEYERKEILDELLAAEGHLNINFELKNKFALYKIISVLAKLLHLLPVKEIPSHDK